MTLHLLVNDQLKRAVVIGRGIKTKEPDLTEILAAQEQVPMPKLFAHVMLALAGNSPESASVEGEMDTPSSIRRLAKYIVANNCRRIITHYNTKRKEPVERGTVEGEYHGVPLDDGLAHPDVDRYIIVGSYGMPRTVIGHRVGRLSDERVNWLTPFAESTAERGRRNVAQDLLERYLGIPDYEFTFGEMLTLTAMGAKMRCELWAEHECVTAGVNSPNQMDMTHLTQMRPDLPWIPTGRTHFEFYELDKKWFVIEI